MNDTAHTRLDRPLLVDGSFDGSAFGRIFCEEMCPVFEFESRDSIRSTEILVPISIALATS